MPGAACLLLAGTAGRGAHPGPPRQPAWGMVISWWVTTTGRTNRESLFLAAPRFSAVLLAHGSHLGQGSSKGKFSPEGILVTLNTSEPLGLLPEDAGEGWWEGTDHQLPRQGC